MREAIGKWAARCNLNRDPEMPAGFRGRTADNWRCLVAIADDLGFGYDEAARAAAVALGSDRQYENQHITLLTDIRTAFNRYDKDRLRTKAELIPALAGLEDSPWGEWTGLDGIHVQGSRWPRSVSPLWFYRRLHPQPDAVRSAGDLA